MWYLHKYNILIYEGESVNRSQMGIKLKTHDIGTWEKHLFLDISSANIDTLVPSLYQHVETRTTEILTVLSANSVSPFHNLRLSNVLERIYRTTCEPR
jgi:hypothetical protein